MYNIESSNVAVNNFNEYLKFYLFKLQSSLDTVVMELESESDLSKIKEVMTAREMLKYKDTIIRFDESLLIQFKVIEYYLNAGAYEAPQVYDAINKIKKSDILNNTTRFQNNNIKKAELLDEIAKVKNIIDGVEVDFDYYVSLLTSSDLHEQDKLSLLALKAFESTKMTKKEEISPSIESIISSVESKKEKIDFSDLETRFKELTDEANKLKNKYYYLFEGKTTSQLSYHFEAVKAYGDNFVENAKKFSYKEGAMIGCLYYIAKTVEDIKSINTNGNMSDREIYELYLQEMEDVIRVSYEIGSYLDEVTEEKEKSSSNILYFTDTHGRTLFNISDFDSDDRKSIETLLNKLENGQYDYLKGGIKSTQVNGSITPIFINKSGRMACSYIRLDDDIVMLLTCDTLKEIYNKTLSIEKKNIEYIKKLKEDFRKLSEEEKEAMIRQQDELRFNMQLLESEAVL